MLKPGFIMTLCICLFSCQTKTSQKSSIPEHEGLIVDFWNGNRSEIRQNYERAILEAVLEVTSARFGSYKISESRDDYPGHQESLAFSEKQHDVLVTVAGNQKFNSNEVIIITQPLAKNLLGYRIPIIKTKDHLKFKTIAQPQLKELTHGIPETWSDADIFRHNAFNVSEKGSFDDIFNRLDSDQFDYTTFGANEVNSIFKNRASKVGGLMIEENLIIFYPFPLVFYVNPTQKKLAQRIENGLTTIENNGTLDAIFDTYYGNLVQDLNIKSRQLISLENPLIPDEFSDLKPNF